jgi:hypothetical protein
MKDQSNLRHDPDFGDLTYDWGWVGTCQIEFLGKLHEVRLFVSSLDGSNIEAIQRDAFVRFLEGIDVHTQTATDAIFAHYQAECGALRAQFGEYADEWAPVIKTQRELGQTIQLDELFVGDSFDRGDRVVGLLFSCTWAQELGFAAKFIDEELVEVGPQNIIL